MFVLMCCCSTIYDISCFDAYRMILQIRLNYFLKAMLLHDKKIAFAWQKDSFCIIKGYLLLSDS